MRLQKSSNVSSQPSQPLICGIEIAETATFPEIRTKLLAIPATRRTPENMITIIKTQINPSATLLLAHSLYHNEIPNCHEGTAAAIYLTHKVGSIDSISAFFILLENTSSTETSPKSATALSAVSHGFWRKMAEKLTGLLP